MECVRIIAMSMILIWHFFIHGGGNFCITIRYFAPLVIAGVNLFILLSGFFNIRLRWSAILNLSITILVFQLISTCATYMLTDNTLSTYDTIMIFIAPLTKSQYYFIDLYVVLMLLSPIINKGLNNMEYKQIRWLVLLLSVVEFYSCWLLHSKICPSNGIWHFVYMYILGSYLAKEPLQKRISLSWIFIIAFIAILTNTLFNALLLQHYTFPQEYFQYDFASLYSMKYVNPLTVLFSVSVILFFSKLNFVNRVINSIANAALGCYLLQEGFFGKWIYEQQKALIQESFASWVFWCIILFFAFWICSWLSMFLIDYINTHVMNLVEQCVPQKYLFKFK